jgi:phage gp46-like protein
VYAVAEKAVWIHDDQKCDLLVATACRIADRFQHLDISTRLCEQRLKHVSTNNKQRVSALYQMARSCLLMANPQLAQAHLMEALQVIESSNDYEKANLENAYEAGEFMLGGHICMHLFLYV